LPQHFTCDLASGVNLWKAEPRRLDLEFDVTNVSNSTYQIATESEEIPLQYAPSRTVGGSLKFHFGSPMESGGVSRPANLSNNWPGSCAQSRQCNRCLATPMKRSGADCARFSGTKPNDLFMLIRHIRRG